MTPPYGGGFRVHEGLDAEADAVDAVSLGCFKGLAGELVGGRFERDLRLTGHMERRTDRFEETCHVLGLEQAWGAPTEVNRVDRLREHGIAERGSGTGFAHLLAEVVDVVVEEVRREDVGGEVAEAALVLAERDGEVETGGFCFGWHIVIISCGFARR